MTAITITYRPCGSGPDTPWTHVATCETPAEADDHLALWIGPCLSHGDLVRVAGAEREWLYVVDEGELFRAVPLLVDEWEGADANATTLLERGEAVDYRRCVLAAGDVVRAVWPSRQDQNEVLAAVSLVEPSRAVAYAAVAAPAARAEHAAIVRRRIPLSVIACALAGVSDPCPREWEAMACPPLDGVAERENR